MNDGLPPRRDPIDAATLTGLVDLENPDPGTITRDAIAHGLSVINRWCGSLEHPLSVAQHSVLVRRIYLTVFPELRGGAVYALLHDAHEYIVGDITGPAERALAAVLPGFRQHLGNLKERCDVAIRQSLSLPAPSNEIRAAVHEADMLAADLEWRLWMPAKNGPSPFAAYAKRNRPHGFQVVRPIPPIEAGMMFRAELEQDLGERAWEHTAA